MRLGARFAWLYVPCLVVAALSPIHLRRSMTRSFVTGGGGDLVSFDWELVSWPTMIELLRYMRPEESRVATLIGAATISLIAAAHLALCLASLWWLFSRRGRTPSPPG
jgi:hypothetical protein